MNAKLNEIQRLKFSLLLSVSIDKAAKYFSDRPESQGASFHSVRTNVVRWANRECIPKLYQNFFADPKVSSYLNNGDINKESLIDQALDVLSSVMNITGISMKDMIYNYNLLFKGEQQSFKYLSVRDEPGRPYYLDRHKPDFLYFHLKMLPDELEVAVRKKLLHVDLNGCKKYYPALNLLDDGVVPSVSNNLIRREFTEYGESYKDFIETTTKPHNTDSSTFAISSLDRHSGKIDLFASSYFKALFNCDKYFYSMISLYSGLNEHQIKQYKDHEVTKQWISQLSDIILENNYDNIEASIGCSCLLVYNTPKGYQTLIAKKHPNANGAQDSHVIPACMFQPMGISPLQFEEEIDIEMQIIREISEEIFCYPERKDIHPDMYYEEVKSHHQISHLLDLMDKGRAKIYITGLYLDLFRLRPEILTMLVVDDVEWYQKSFTHNQQFGNWEYVRGAIFPVPMTSKGFAEVIERESAGYLCAPGAAAVIKGFETFHKIYGNDTD